MAKCQDGYHNDADNLVEYTTDAGEKAVRCRKCRQLIMKEWWLRASDAQLLRDPDSAEVWLRGAPGRIGAVLRWLFA